MVGLLVLPRFKIGVILLLRHIIPCAHYAKRALQLAHSAQINFNFADFTGDSSQVRPDLIQSLLAQHHHLVSVHHAYL